jgi:hypothetical protein
MRFISSTSYIEKDIEKIKVPKDIEQLLLLKLPLLQRHVDLLNSRIENIIKAKDKKSYTFILETNGRGIYQYEIKNRIVYSVLIGEIDYKNYFDNYWERVFELRKKKKRYTPVYDIINHLMKNAGFPNEIMFGQHALTNYLINYLDTKKVLKGKRRDDGFMYYSIVSNG